MHVLITGGAGFLGSHFCDALLQGGERVTVLDDLSTGRRSNLAHLEGDERFRLVVGSVCDEALVRRLVETADRVVHLAAVVGVRLVFEEPARTLETNVVGTKHVLRAAAERGVRVLFASSSEVYGPLAEPPLTEDTPLRLDSVQDPRAAYARSKAFGEWLAQAHQREVGSADGFGAVIVRLFNTVGPRQTGRYGMVLPTFVAQAVGGEPLTVYGDGSQTRTFLHVRDSVRACLTLLDERATGGQVFNVGGTEEITIAELALLVRRLACSRSSVVRMPYREAYGLGFRDFPRRRPSTEKLQAHTGFAPTRKLSEIVAELVAKRSATAGPLARILHEPSSETT